MAGLGRVAGDEHEPTVQIQSILQRGHIAVGCQLERHEHVSRCFTVPAASTRIYRDGTSAQVTSMSQMFAYASSFNRSLRRWNTNAVDNEQWSAGTYIGRVDLYTFSAATAWYARYATCGYKTDAVCSDVVDFSNDLSFIFHYSYNGDRYALAAFVRKDNACDASTPPVRRRRQLHRHPRERHVLRPGVRPGYVLKGVTSCTNRVLTEWLCAIGRLRIAPSSRRPWTRAWMLCRLGRGAAPRDPQCWHPDTGHEAMRRRWMRGHA